MSQLCNKEAARSGRRGQKSSFRNGWGKLFVNSAVLCSVTSVFFFTREEKRWTRADFRKSFETRSFWRNKMKVLKTFSFVRVSKNRKLAFVQKSVLSVSSVETTSTTLTSTTFWEAVQEGETRLRGSSSSKQGYSLTRMSRNVFQLLIFGMFGPLSLILFLLSRSHLAFSSSFLTLSQSLSTFILLSVFVRTLWMFNSISLSSISPLSLSPHQFL